MILDLIITNADVITMDAARPRAHAIGVWQGRIIGLDDDLDGLTSARTVDAAGATLLPGFHDAHCHTSSFGVEAGQLPLGSSAGIDDVLRQVAGRAAATATTEWIIGTGYLDRNEPNRHPTRWELDQAGSGLPVWLTHRSGHQCSVSSAVLDLLPDSLPAGMARHVERDGSGCPTGVLMETAMDLVKEIVGPGSVSEIVKAISWATTRYLTQGITGFTEAGIGVPGNDHSPLEIAAYQRARSEGVLNTRAQLMVYSEILHDLPGHNDDDGPFGLDLGMHTGWGDDWLKLGAAKVWIDGAGTADTAAVSPRSSEIGMTDNDFVDDPARLSRTIQNAHRSGWQVAGHAMGDRAVDLLLDSLAAAGPIQEIRARRHRIEHAGLVRPDQLQRIVDLGVVVVIQPAFISTFGDMFAQNFGSDRLSWSIRAKSLMDRGVIVAASSDRPVAPGAPLIGIQAMAERLTESSARYAVSERTTVLQAVESYTASAAYAGHNELSVGTLATGKLADLVLLEADPTATEITKIQDIAVLATMVDGHVAHDPNGMFDN